VRARARLGFALALSVLIHAHILSLWFGSARFGLPSLALPKAEQRITVRLVPAPAPAAEPVRLALSQQLSPITPKPPKPVTPSRADGSFEVQPPRAVDAVPPPAQLSVPRRDTREPAPAAKARARERKVRPKPQPQILAQSDPQQETFKVPPPKKPAEAEPQRAPASAAKKQTEESPPAAQATEQTARRQAEEAARLQAEEAAARQRAEEDARRQALELEARRVAEEKETARREAEELARQRALALQKDEAKRLEDARKVEEAQKQAEALKQEELKKQEEARRMALEAEALRRAEELARQQAAARQKELEARRQAEEAAARAKETAERQRLEGEAAAQRERDRLAAQQPPAPPGALSGRDLAAKAIDQLRTPGAARDDLLRPPSPPTSIENPRRRALFGVERDVPLRMYVESWRSKIERNGPLNYRRSASTRAPDNPIVTVSIRSDGSLEDVVIHRSSGLRELDEAVRRIARLYAPYSAFPPALARQYDVLDIRRVWSFEDTLRIMDEM